MYNVYVNLNLCVLSPIVSNLLSINTTTIIIIINWACWLLRLLGLVQFVHLNHLK